MFKHLLKYRMIELFRQREILFWNMIFPMLLATFLYISTSGLNDEDLIDTMRVYTDQPLVAQVLEQVEYNDKDLYTVVHVDNVEEALKNQEIDAAVRGDDVKIEAMEESMEIHVLQGVIVKFLQVTESLELAFSNDMDALPEETIQEIIDPEPLVVREEGSDKQANLSYFYSVLDMAALSSITLGVVNVNDTEPQFSTSAQRLAVAPARRFKVVSAYTSASFFFSCLSTGATLAYLHFILKISFGTHWLATFALLAVGIIVSLLLGMCIGLIPKMDVGSKIGVGIATYMLFSTLGGMMGPGLKHLLRAKVPPLYSLNPSALMTDGIGSLYYLETFSIYFKHLAIMAVMALLLLLIFLWIALRGTRYEHI